MLTGVKAFYRRRFSKWLSRRIPETSTVVLDRRNLFILPTRTGVAFLAVLVVMWLVATNYENNLVFVITFLLTAMFVISIHHTHNTLSGITLSVHKTHPAFRGESCSVEIQVARTNNRSIENALVFFSRDKDDDRREISRFDLAEDQSQMIAQVRTQAGQRGWFDPGRLTIESVYPLGIFRVWTHIKLDARCLVYPTPIKSQVVPSQASSTDEGVINTLAGSEDFIGLDNYEPGQSLRHVAWKHYAREQGLLTKYYGDYQDQRVWLDWDDFPGLEREARLSRLCGLAIDFANRSISYGLRLPGITLAPDQGVHHKMAVLKQLALFEVDQLSPAQPGSS